MRFQRDMTERLSFSLSCIHIYVSVCVCFKLYVYKVCLQNYEYTFNINNLGYADDTTLMTESEEELKSLLIKVQEESEKVGF